ncbi:flagellin N-terminal helical domain-containing protein [Halobacillus sp. B29]|uniref:flagellin N-terminal helical domain-containing protein n=1 Tax=Halobacillus sp. B29 TaxID=3457432 RepID=UPI003FCCFCC4
MRINHNIAALNTHRQLGQANNAQQNSMEKLSSGLRINNASDDAAGLAISEKMRSQIRGLDQASRNAQDGVSLVQTAEGALNETHSILQRMRELSVQSANDTNTDADRQELQKEMSELQKEVTRISGETEFNTKTLMNGDLESNATGISNTNQVGSVEVVDFGDNLSDGATITMNQLVTHDAESTTDADDGAFQKVDIELGNGSNTQTVSFSKAEIDAGTTSKEVTIDGATLKINLDDPSTLSSSQGNGAGTQTSDDSLTMNDNSLKFQIGANQDQSISLGINDMSSEGLGIDTIDISSQSGANSAVTTLDGAIETVSAERSKLGAYQNRLEHTINNLGTSSENLTASESRIRDVDMAKEMMNQTKSSILAQASQAMLAKANQMPQGVLQLLR